MDVTFQANLNIAIDKMREILRSCSKAVAASTGLQKLKQPSAQNDVAALFHMNSSWDHLPSNPNDLLVIVIFSVNGKLSACHLLQFRRM
jgi:hypothetical protein